MGGIHMNQNRKILVIGGTGAMGTYLVPKLAEDGYQVDVISMDDVVSPYSNLHYFKGKADELVPEFVKNHYDAIVDFMIYPTEKFRAVHPMLLGNTDHYIFLSSYRVFDETKGWTKEDSPQILDASDDQRFLATDDYALLKSRGEDILEQSSFRNWTVIRPAITYSQKRCQLVTLERHQLLPFIRSNTPVLLPAAAMPVQGTMTWAGDVAEMIRRLLLKEGALCDYFNVTTSEHHTWAEVAEYYRDLFNLDCQLVEEEPFIQYFWGHASADEQYRRTMQLRYDRLFERQMDNSKILNFTGLKQSDLTPLYEGLKRERESLLAD